MIQLKIKYKNKGHNQGSIRIRRFSKKLIPNIKRALVKVGSLLEAGIKRNLSGPSHTRHPGNGNPYPGTLTGRLKGSVIFKMSDGGLTVTTGPDTVYAAVQEFGGGNIPARPYVEPVLQAEFGHIELIVFSAVMEPL